MSSDSKNPAASESGGGEQVVATFSIPRVGFLDADARECAPLPAFARDTDALAKMYRAMVFTRTFDAKAVALQRTGRLGTYASSLGQEAVSVGIGAAMRSEDILVPAFREHGTQLMRGVTPVELLLYWGGYERGIDWSAAREDFPVSIPVGSHAPHAAGIALAVKLRRQARAVVCVIGDGATSKGDFYEALNVAGVWTLPLVFVVNNNQWAISVPRAAQTAAETFAQKAVAGGIEGVQVDGNDVIAVRHAVERALDRAREGGGATLVEADTYRLADHTTADDSTRYRDEDEVSERWKLEPVARLRNYLVANGGWSKGDEQKLIGECSTRIDAAADEYLTAEPDPPAAMFDWLHAELPADLEDQRRMVEEDAYDAD
jgi:pyruvate dehydrogenase E1 component alpha subunit